jgi:CBS domain-containing protein
MKLAPCARRIRHHGAPREAFMRTLSDIVCDQTPLILGGDETVKTACEKMRTQHVGSVLVTDENGKLIGIFTGRDAVYRVIAEGKSAARTKLADVMTAEPVSMGPEKTAIDALRLMWDGGFRHLPLVKGTKILGVVSRGDFSGVEQMRLDDERDLWEHLR